MDNLSVAVPNHVNIPLLRKVLEPTIYSDSAKSDGNYRHDDVLQLIHTHIVNIGSVDDPRHNYVGKGIQRDRAGEGRVERLKS